MATATLRAAIYTRVSQDASGVARSPKEQEAQSRRDCERNGWQVVDVYTDNDRSASRYARKARPDYVRLLAAIAGGMFDVLVVWEASRLTRDLEAYVTLAAACRSAGVRLSYGGKLLDLDNPDDEFNVGLEMLLGQRESGVARKRILRNVRANAEAGRPHGRVQYGYRRVYDAHTGRLLGQEPDPDTAPHVVELFQRVGNGETLYRIVQDFNTRGVPTRAGLPWASQRVRQIIGSTSYLGHRSHKGAVVVENAWPAVVDETLFYRARAVLADPSRRTARDSEVRHLLSGLLVCGRCGADVRYSGVGSHARPVYRCKVGGHVARLAGVLETGVRLLICEGLARPDALAMFAPPDINVTGFTAEVAALNARLDEADEALVGGDLSPRAHGKLEARLRARLDELDTALSRARRQTPTPLVDLTVGRPDARAVLDRFNAADITVQRLVVRALLVDCELRPAPVRGRPRDDLGLRFRWMGATEVTEA